MNIFYKPIYISFKSTPKNPSTQSDELKKSLKSLSKAKSQKEADSLKFKIYKLLEADIRKSANQKAFQKSEQDEIFQITALKLFEILNNIDKMENPQETINSLLKGIRRDKNSRISSAMSLDKPVGDLTTTLSNFIPDNNYYEGMITISQEEKEAYLNKIDTLIDNSKLDEQRKKILYLRYTEQQKPLTYKEISQQVKKGSNRVSQDLKSSLIQIQYHNNTMPENIKRFMNEFISVCPYKKLRADDI